MRSTRSASIQPSKFEESLFAPDRTTTQPCRKLTLFALNRHEPQKAIELLQAAAPYEFAVPAVNFNTFFGGLYPVYVRGEAFLAAHQGADAAAEFQKILAHPGLVFADPVGALARLQLARTLASSGDKTKAKTAYQDFLTLWKDADPDIPILKETRAEYAKLQ